MKHEAPPAVDFLSWAYPHGPWCLTAIEVDRMGITTATFYPKSADGVYAFMDRHEHCNIYWSVNRPMRDLTKKAEKADIAAVHFLHVDVDPRAGEDLAAERDRIFKLLQTPPGNVPRPSAIVYSGGGFQAIWTLEEPVVINGDLAKVEEIESYNRQLEYVFSADSCHNIDRILRLPGSVNFPSAKKRAKGRTVERARVM